MALKDIKLKIKATDRTRKVTKAMETVSAVKMRKSQLRTISGRPYATAALLILQRISGALSSAKHPLTITRPIKRAAVVVVTSDKGLCGVLNAAVLKKAQTLIQSLNLDISRFSIFAFGRKAAEYFERRGYKVVEKFENVSDDVSITDLAEVTKAITNSFMKGECDTALVVYTNF